MSSHNPQFTPPAATLDVTVRNPFLPDRATDKIAMLDTAADIDAIRQSLVRSLDLRSARTTAVSGVDSVSTPYRTYIVSLEFAETTIERIAVIEWAGNEILLGRDVLNEFEIRLDGKTRQFEIRDP
jgi:hypothetical protein